MRQVWLLFYQTVYFFQGRAHIFKIHARSMSVEKDIRYELLARLCPNSTGKTHPMYCTFLAINDCTFLAS